MFLETSTEGNFVGKHTEGNSLQFFMDAQQVTMLIQIEM